MMRASTTEVRLGKWRLTPRADYDITARILSRADYRFDALADLIPEDLALGWGPMSDNRCWRTSTSSSRHASTAGGRMERCRWRADGDQPQRQHSSDSGR